MRENKVPAMRYGDRLTHPTNWGISCWQIPWILSCDRRSCRSCRLACSDRGTPTPIVVSPPKSSSD
ncbi:MAG: hypothetical protein NW214_10380 [Pseudanabaenaceae cyanobacterium bins.39]|nr:hypothetical protein [Pseudanabaenaceae cyanobacterium bins.39]